ncbi:MAG TPA: adenylate/guanylate cyclase domain-containing protein [Acidimicrobiia bacterium]|nr:adenylate/guanylate cyclase domain-containing protein [Acidimicrobiia bacterium]
MWRRLAAFLAELGREPTDTAELALAKRLLVVTNALIVGLAIPWVLLYLAFDEYLAASIPGAYIVVTAACMVAFFRNRRFVWYRNSQLAIMLVLPFALQLALGGYLSGSAVVLWSLISPLGAQALSSARVARRLFAAFVGLVVLAALLEPLIPQGNRLPPSLVLAFFVMNVVGSSVVAFVLIDLFINQLHAERARSERLLLNVLPARIAARLRLRPEEVIAERFEQASVLFADVVDFTPLSAGLSPEELVAMLNEIFTDFDALAEKHGVEKIKTVGDSYMVAAGVPTPRSDHAQALAEMALDIQAYSASNRWRVEQPLRFRIGINSGPVVAGVIGRRKFIYDLWGDVVNTASRMESHGVPGTIQLTEATYLLLRDQYVCVPHGIIDVKGKGPTPTWHLTGRR